MPGRATTTLELLISSNSLCVKHFDTPFSSPKNPSKQTPHIFTSLKHFSLFKPAQNASEVAEQSLEFRFPVTTLILPSSTSSDLNRPVNALRMLLDADKDTLEVTDPSAKYLSYTRSIRTTSSTLLELSLLNTVDLRLLSLGGVDSEEISPDNVM
jgi:hypothetical protein